VANGGYLALENALKPFLVLMERYFRGIRGSIDGAGKGVDH